MKKNIKRGEKGRRNISQNMTDYCFNYIFTNCLSGAIMKVYDVCIFS